MKIYRDWLGDYVDLTDLTDAEIAERLTEIGHAVEGIEQHEGSAVFEVEFTTNRVDAMSHLGVARELSAALGREMLSASMTPELQEHGNEGEFAFPIAIDDSEGCSRYTGLVIRGVKIAPSSHEVQKRLVAAGLRPINNVVDATNYTMLATGHPLHAFDLDKLRSGIRVRRGRAGEKMRSLDGIDRAFDDQTIVIGDGELPVALGGVIGGAETEISDSTVNVLLECAHFHPGLIRRTARRLGIKTDASYRFERGVDPNDTVETIRRCASIIVNGAGGRSGAPVDVVARAVEPKRIALRDARLEEATAGIVGPGYALELFRRLGFEAARTPDGTSVRVPTYRGDIDEETDLIEEVLRFYGFNRVPGVLPRLSTGDAQHDATGEVEEALRDVLAGSGCTEVVTYSFVHPRWNAAMTDEEPLGIGNALTENISSMRLSLIPGLLDVAAYNRSYGTRDGVIFEAGRTYHRAGDGVAETPRIAIAMFGGAAAHWSGGRRAYDFFDLKGIVEAVYRRAHLAVRFEPVTGRWLREGAASAIWLEDERIGVAGAVSREVLQLFDLKGDVFAAELDLAPLLRARSRQWKIDPVSRFPGVPMVLGVLHAPDLSYERILAAITRFEVPNLVEVGVRDRYVPDGGSKGEVKTTLGFWYQASDRSLTQDEVAEAHASMTSRLLEALPLRLAGAHEKENA